MSTKPSSLLGSYKIHEGEKNDEDVFFELIHSLSVLPSPETATENLLCWSSGILFHEESSSIDFVDMNNTKPDEYEWKCGLILLTKILDISSDKNDEATSTSTCNTNDEDISPHDILRCIVDRCFGYDDDQEEGASLFKIVCIMLVSVAIRNLSSPIKTLKQRRWRRTQSMCMESIALYQSLFLRKITDVSKVSELEMLSTLFCDYLSPELHTLLDEMREAANSTNISRGPLQYKNKAIAAGIVNLVSNLSLLIVEADALESDHAIATSTLIHLSKVLLSVPFSEEFIWMHPLRIEYECSRCRSLGRLDYDDEEEYVDESAAEEKMMRELSPLLCKSTNDLGLDFDALCGMNVQWDERALAVMIHVAISNKNMDKCSVLFPSVYSEDMIFTIAFPHIATLLNLSQISATESEKEECTSYISSAQQMKKRQHYFEMAMNLLEFIFANRGNEILSIEFIRRYHGDRLNVTKGALSPVGALQLLLNHLVNISSTNKGISDPTEYNPERVIGVVRKILSIYPVAVQISSIALLVKLCPMPFVLPLLLDLLRKPISSDEFSDIPGCLSILNPFIEEMVTLLSTTNYTQKLVENGEIYSCVVSLVRLLNLKVGKHHSQCKDDLNRVIDHMKKFRTFLHEMDEKIFRLFILELALDDLLNKT